VKGGTRSVRDDRWQELTDEECRKLLGERHLGRLALVDADGPVILPVNYTLDEGSVVFRTDPDGKLDAAAAGRRSRSRSTPSTAAAGDPHRAALQAVRTTLRPRHHSPVMRS